MLLAPGEELRDGFGVGRARVPVPDRRREEFDEAPGGGFTGAPDRGRQVFEPGAREIPRWDWDEISDSWAGAIHVSSGCRTPRDRKNRRGQSRRQPKRRPTGSFFRTSFRKNWPFFALLTLPQLMPHKSFMIRPGFRVSNRN